MAKNDFHKKCQFVISNILKGNINWGKEMKIAKLLVAEYPEKEFWETLYMETYPTSLSIFLTDIGRKVLLQEYRAFKAVEEPEEIKLSEKPVVQIESNPTKKSPKTVQQFVDETL